MRLHFAISFCIAVALTVLCGTLPLPLLLVLLLNTTVFVRVDNKFRSHHQNSGNYQSCKACKHSDINIHPRETIMTRCKEEFM